MTFYIWSDSGYISNNPAQLILLEVEQYILEVVYLGGGDHVRNWVKRKKIIKLTVSNSEKIHYNFKNNRKSTLKLNKNNFKCI